MRFQTPLIPGRLIRRWNRFLCEVTLDSGEVVCAHCPNPGAMLGLKDPGLRVWLEPSDDPKRKLRHGWRLVEFGDGHWAGIDTAVPNRVVGDALRARAIRELAAYGGVRAEVAMGTRSRVDFVLSEPGLPDAWVEVKNVHLMRGDGLAEFPDCVTLRGAKHLRELSAIAATGQRAVMLYLVQRTDCTALAIADDLDPGYADAFAAAHRAGVEMLCYDTVIGTTGVTLGRALPVLGP